MEITLALVITAYNTKSEKKHQKLVESVMAELLIFGEFSEMCRLTPFLAMSFFQYASKNGSQSYPKLTAVFLTQF